MAWRAIGPNPGAAEINNAYGRRLKAKRDVDLQPYVGSGGTPPSSPVNIRFGTICFFGRPAGQDIIVVVPSGALPPTATIGSLAPGMSASVVTNWAGLQMNFEMDL